MTILKDFSIIWSLVHTLVMFLLLFESRYSKKKTLILSACTMIPLIILSLVLFIVKGAEFYLKIMILVLSLPSFVFFWFLAKHRDGRFVFTFCMIDTIVLEIIYVTNIIDHYIPGYWFMFIVRLVAYPLIELFIYKKFKRIYRDIQTQVKKGWWIFALIGVMFYITITLSASVPTMITERVEYMPAFVILLLLMPISYINILNALRHQRKVYESQEQEDILRVQVADIKSRIEEFSSANDKFRIERHDFRHKLQTIKKMLDDEKFDELRSVVTQYDKSIEETKVKRYCSNAVLDAVFSSYLSRAESKGIKVNSNINFPQTLNVSDVELATVFANAIENAINACEKTEVEKRWIDIKVITSPRFMINISNGFNGVAEFDEDGIPVTNEEGHGFGTRSIVAFCEKNGAFYEFKADEDRFALRIVF